MYRQQRRKSRYRRNYMENKPLYGKLSLSSNESISWHIFFSKKVSNFYYHTFRPFDRFRRFVVLSSAVVNCPVTGKNYFYFSKPQIWLNFLTIWRKQDWNSGFQICDRELYFTFLNFWIFLDLTEKFSPIFSGFRKLN